MNKNQLQSLSGSVQPLRDLIGYPYTLLLHLGPAEPEGLTTHWQRM